MVTSNVIGLQWGDEGKGKTVDDETERATRDGRAIVARFQGGPNAGHTLEVDEIRLGLHLMGSGILNKKAYNLLTAGVYVNPEKLNEEIDSLRAHGIEVGTYNFGVSSKAHLLLPNHVAEDKVNFGEKAWSSTANGISQSARDKNARTGIRIISALDEKLLEHLITQNFIETYGDRATRVFLDSGTIKKYTKQVHMQALRLEDYIVDEAKIFTDKQFKNIIFEGAQGLMIGVDYGEYNGTTSTSPLLVPRKYDYRIGVFKLYSSSVGTEKRPFVADMKHFYTQEQITQIRNAWGEYGVSTGRPRNIGAFDLLAAKYALSVSDPDFLIGTCLDKLEEIGKLGLDLYVVEGYEINGKKYYEREIFMDNPMALENAKPILKKFKSWTKTIDEKGNLCDEAKTYVSYLEKQLDIEFSKLGIGPKRGDNIVRPSFAEVQKYS